MTNTRKDAIIKARAKKQLERIKRISFKDFVEERYLIKQGKNKIFQDLCPFHDDEKIGSAYIYNAADTGIAYFNCKSAKCKTKGKTEDIVSFVMEKEGLSFTEAKNILKEYLHLEVEKKERKIEKIEKNEELINNVYKHIRDNLTLEKADEIILSRQGRMYSKKDVKTWDSKKALKIAKEKFKIEDLVRVPGFHLENGELKIMETYNKIAIFVKNTRNNIIAVQLRSVSIVDIDNETAKYIMLSSTNNAANMGYFFTHGKEGGSLAIAEGYFKSKALNTLGFGVFGLQGLQTLVQNTEQIADAARKTTRYKKMELNFFLDLDVALSKKKRDFVIGNLTEIMRRIIQEEVRENGEINYDDIKINICIHKGDVKGIDDYINYCNLNNLDIEYYKLDAISFALNLRDFRRFEDMRLDLDEEIEKQKDRVFKSIEIVRIENRIAIAN